MKTLYFDCFSGISGDMTIGALIDLGVGFDYVKAELAKLPVTGYSLAWSRVVRANLSAGKFDVVIPESAGSGHSHPQGHSHDHLQHGHDDHRHRHDGGPHAHRRASEILDMIRSSALPGGARKRAIAIFEKLAISEGRVHRMPPEDVEFHEVGAIDSIVDVVGAAIGIDALGIDEAVCSPINVGGGFIQCQHGVYPAPSPATSNLLIGAPVYSKHTETELVTPTGAAILAATVGRFAPLDLTIERVGYGAGTRDLGAFPNCLRLFLGSRTDTGAGPGRESAGDETVLMLEANIDDMSAEDLAWAAEKLMAAGALDVVTFPALMKKGRPGHVLEVMGRPDQEGVLTGILFEETTTIGLRAGHVTRHVLDRETVSVQTRFGPVGVKVARRHGRVLNASPEYEDCARIARQTGEPLHRIREEALRSYQEVAKPQPPPAD